MPNLNLLQQNKWRKKMADISFAKFEQFNEIFEAMLGQRGSVLMNYTTPEEVHGEVKYLRQYNIGDAYFVDTIGAPTSYVNASFHRRKLEPRAMECSIMIDQYHQIQAAGLDVNELAQEAANKCGILLDKLIINGIGGVARTTESGDVKFPASQVIASDTQELNNEGNTGLTAAKIALAVEMLREKFNATPLVCVTNNYGLAQLRTDERVASVMFNMQPAMATGQNMAYGGCDVFVPCEQCGGDGDETQYAYMYALDKIRLGCSMPFHIEAGQNAERGLNTVFIVKGMYDCLRMEEEAVVRIEWKR